MMPLVDRPFVAHQIDLLRRHGIDDVDLLVRLPPGRPRGALRRRLGHRACACATWWTPSRSAPPAPSRTPRALLDGDAVPRAERRHPHRPRPRRRSIARHRETGAVGTLALTPVEDPSAFGLVRLHDDGSVEAFVEKPQPRRAAPRRALPHQRRHLPARARPRWTRIPAGRACSIEREVFPAARGRAAACYGFPSDAYWRDIGTPASYLAANHDVLSGALVTESPSGAAYLGPGRARRARAPRSTALSSLGAGAVVGAGGDRGGQRGRRGGARSARAPRSIDAILGAGRAGGRGRAHRRGRGRGRRRRASRAGAPRGRPPGAHRARPCAERVG